MEQLTWRKSSRSGNGGDTCVEAARTPAGTIATRDSTRPDAPWLRFSPDAWRAFLADVKRGRFDL